MKASARDIRQRSTTALSCPQSSRGAGSPAHLNHPHSEEFRPHPPTLAKYSQAGGEKIMLLCCNSVRLVLLYWLQSCCLLCMPAGISLHVCSYRCIRRN